MSDDRVHRVVSADGTEVAGWIRGDGPPLVLVSGGTGDGHPDANPMASHLAAHFTCFFMSPSGLGLSGDREDISRERTFEDFAAFVRGIGEPVSVFAHSAGAVSVCGGVALAGGGACSAIALYEPALPISRPVMQGEAYASFCVAVSEGRAADAFWIFVDDVVVPTDDERVLLALPGVAEAAASGFPNSVRRTPEINRPVDPAWWAHFDMPVLLFQGENSSPHYKDAVSHVADEVSDARLRQIEGAGHLGPMTHAAAVADDLIAFVSTS